MRARERYYIVAFYLLLLFFFTLAREAKKKCVQWNNPRRDERRLYKGIYAYTALPRREASKAIERFQGFRIWPIIRSAFIYVHTLAIADDSYFFIFEKK